MPLINCQINLIVTCSACCVISNTVTNQETTFGITDIKLYVLVITLSTDDNGELLPKLISSHERTINWNKYQSKVTIHAQNRYLNYLNDLSFK